jgi:5-methylcytosine-specific restriction endonuclease McrA
MIPTEKIKLLPDQKSLIQFVASAELMGKLEELKDIFAHRNFEGRMNVLVDQLADIALQKFRPASVRKPASSSKLAPTSPALETSFSTPAPGMKSTLRNTALALAQSNQKPYQSDQKSNLSKRSRYIPARIRRQVLLRDQNGCTFKDPKTGRVCGAKRGLQFDHIMPFGWGGEHSVDNLALRCGAHNRFRAQQMHVA